MQRTLVIRGASISDCIAFGMLSALFVGLACSAPLLPGNANDWTFMVVFCSAFAIAPLAGLVHAVRRRAITWVADDRSVRMERRGTLVWECRWEDFGGWQRLNRRWFEYLPSQRHEILNRDGAVVGELDIAAYGPGDVAFFRRTLDLNTPKGGPTPGPLPTAKPKFRTTRGRCVLLMGIGVGLWLAGSGIHWALFGRFPDQEPPDRSAYRIVIPMCLYLSGATSLTLGVLGLLRLANPAVFDASRRMPIQGPTLSDFLLDRPKLMPVDLVEGLTYGYVDCDNRQKQYEGAASALAFSRFGCFAPLLLFTIPIGIHVTNDFITGSLTLIGTLVGLFLLLGFAAKRLKARSVLMEDRIRLVGDELTVTHAGTERTYKWSARKIKGVLWSRDFMHYQYKFEYPPAYTFDPRYITEMPTGADLAEMKEMRDRIESIV